MSQEGNGGCMMIGRKWIGVWAGVLGLLLALGAGRVEAGLYVQDFTGDDGTQPADWSPFWEGADTITRITGNTYQASTSSSATNKPLMAYTGGNSANWDDYTVTARVSSSFWNSGTFYMFGVAARIQPDGSQFYHAGIQGGQLRIYLGTSSNAFAQLLAESPVINGYGVNSMWQIVFDVQGESLQASVYDSVGTLRGTVSATDGTLASGYAGVWATISNSQLVTWDDFSVSGEVVPEPATLGLMAAGLAAAATRRRHA